MPPREAYCVASYVALVVLMVEFLFRVQATVAVALSQMLKLAAPCLAAHSSSFSFAIRSLAEQIATVLPPLSRQ